MNKREIVKTVTGFVVGAGVSKIIADAVVNNVSQEKNLQKAVVFAGKTGITMVVSDAVRAHTDAKIDAVADWMKRTIEVFKK